MSGIAYFITIETSINHDWIDESVASSTARRSDKAPIPDSIWDQRLIATFTDRPVDLKFLSTLKKWALSRHRVNLRHLFAHYLRITFSFEWQDFLRRKRLSCKGGK